MIFRRYIDEKSAMSVLAELEEGGVRSKARITVSGKHYGGNEEECAALVIESHIGIKRFATGVKMIVTPPDEDGHLGPTYRSLKRGDEQLTKAISKLAWS